MDPTVQSSGMKLDAHENKFCLYSFITYRLGKKNVNCCVTCLRLHVSSAMYAKIKNQNENKCALGKAVVSSMSHLYRVCFNPYSEDWCSSIITVNTVRDR